MSLLRFTGSSGTVLSCHPRPLDSLRWWETGSFSCPLSKMPSTPGLNPVWQDFHQQLALSATHQALIVILEITFWLPGSWGREEAAVLS